MSFFCQHRSRPEALKSNSPGYIRGQVHTTCCQPRSGLTKYKARIFIDKQYPGYCYSTSFLPKTIWYLKGLEDRRQKTEDRRKNGHTTIAAKGGAQPGRFACTLSPLPFALRPLPCALCPMQQSIMDKSSLLRQEFMIVVRCYNFKF
jgi:hypothetical protein